MQIRTSLLALLVLTGAVASAQNQPILGEDTLKVSEHVWAIMGFPNIFREGGTPASWIAVLDQVEKLGARHVLPDHSAIGDGSLVAQEKAFISDLQTRALALKGQGISAADAGKQITAEFQKKYADWPIRDLTNFVKSVYAE